MKLLDINKEAKKYVSEYHDNHEDMKFLEIGAHPKIVHTSELIKELNIIYNNMDIDTNISGTEVITGDICSCPEIPDESFDIVYSHNVFEHIKTPWTAAEECVRITKTGGLNIHITLFSYRYHESPVDCFRYTHTGLKTIFELSGNMEEVISGYKDITNRNKMKKGRWSENWLVIYIGKKEGE